MLLKTNVNCAYIFLTWVAKSSQNVHLIYKKCSRWIVHNVPRGKKIGFTLPGILTSSSSCTISNTCTSPEDRPSRLSVWLSSFSSPPLAGVGSVGSPARWLDRIRYRSSCLVLHLTLRRSPMILWVLPCDGRKAWWARRGRARASRTCGCTGASCKENWYIR